MKTNIEAEVRKWVKARDCAVFVDKDGDIAVQLRLYTTEQFGRSVAKTLVVQHAPDPADYHSLAKWEDALWTGTEHSLIC